MKNKFLILIIGALSLGLSAGKFSQLGFDEQVEKLTSMGKKNIENHDRFNAFLSGNDEAVSESLSEIATWLEEDKEGVSLGLISELESRFCQEYSPMFTSLAQKFCGKKDVREKITDKEWGFFEIGLGLLKYIKMSFLAEAYNPRNNEHIKSGLDKLVDYYSGGQSFFNRSLTSLESALGSKPSEEAREDVPRSSVNLVELKKATQLSYLAHLNLNLEKEGKGLHKLARAAKFFALIEYGSPDYKAYEKALVIDPFMEKLNAFIQRAPDLYERIDYEFIQKNANDLHYKETDDARTKFFKVVNNHASMLFHTVAMGTYYVDKSDRGSVNTTIKAVYNARKTYYKALTDTALKLGIDQPLAFINETLREDVAFQEVKKMFVSGASLAEGQVPTPRLNPEDCWIWGELVFGYETLRLIQGSPSYEGTSSEG